ncbi:MAG: 1-phosphofructokinase [Mobilitalea sp.]
MIYTVTFNPSLDYIIHMEDLTPGLINRSNSEYFLAGGKGINVSIVLKNLGMESTALGFVSGFTGEEIEREVKNFGCLTDFIHLKEGNSRINIKMTTNTGEETAVNGQGPIISVQNIEDLMSRLEKLQNGDVLVLAGSIPSSLPENIYENIMARIADKHIKTIVDATGNLLVNVLKYSPFMIKPNVHELGEIFETELETHEEIIEHAKKLQAMGARNVLVSMAGDGAILLSEEGKVYFREAPKGKLVNSVGAGDSMVAGFITGYLKYNTYIDAFEMGIASGSASAFSEFLATKEEVNEILTVLRNTRNQ